MNHLISFLKIIYQQGLTIAVIAPGARNASLAKLIIKSRLFECYFHPDERSAAFFVLGLNQGFQSRRAFLLVTSGTAVSETFSAFIEAHYQTNPLTIISADRPQGWAFSGAPQTINQKKIFGDYGHYFEFSQNDFDVNWNLLCNFLKDQNSLHINVYLNDPAKTLKEINSISETEIRNKIFFDHEKKMINHDEEKVNFLDHLNHQSLLEVEKPLIIVGPIESKYYLQFVRKWLVCEIKKNPHIPLILESNSNIFDLPRSHFGIKWLNIEIKNNNIKSVIKIGGTPTTRFWRDLEEEFIFLPVFNFTHRRYPGLARACNYSGNIFDLYKVKITGHFNNQWLLYEHEKQIDLKNLLSKYVHSEWAWFYRLAKQVQNGCVYLGNSLPIREFDLMSWGTKLFMVWGNRGVNGIDGQISSFLGWVLSEHEGHRYYGIFGDLTVFYDLQSLWIYHKYQAQFLKKLVCLIIINNQGGQIFRSTLKEDILINQHDIDFEKWAQMYCVSYLKVTTSENFMLPENGFWIIEIIPDMEEQKKIEVEWNSL